MSDALPDHRAAGFFGEAVKQIHILLRRSGDA
jgi:hypothetical protein